MSMIDFLKKTLKFDDNERFIIDGDTVCFFRDGRLYQGDPNGSYNESAKVLRRLIYNEYNTVEKYVPADRIPIIDEYFDEVIVDLNHEDEEKRENHYELLLIQTIEEQSELIQKLCKTLRYRHKDKTMVARPLEIIDGVKEEMADVQICLSRLMMYENKKDIKKKISEKIIRTFNRLRGDDQ